MCVCSGCDVPSNFDIEGVCVCVRERDLSGGSLELTGSCGSSCELICGSFQLDDTVSDQVSLCFNMAQLCLPQVLKSQSSSICTM